jgi:hypothetical protein
MPERLHRFTATGLKNQLLHTLIGALCTMACLVNSGATHGVTRGCGTTPPPG